LLAVVGVGLLILFMYVITDSCRGFDPPDDEYFRRCMSKSARTAPLLGLPILLVAYVAGSLSRRMWILVIGSVLALVPGMYGIEHVWSAI
jgi:hypothetical protein